MALKLRLVLISIAMLSIQVVAQPTVQEPYESHTTPTTKAGSNDEKPTTAAAPPPVTYLSPLRPSTSAASAGHGAAQRILERGAIWDHGHQYAEAVKEFREALELLQALPERDHADARVQHDIYVCQDYLAHSLSGVDWVRNEQEIVDLSEKALANAERLPPDPGNRYLYYRLALYYSERASRLSDAKASESLETKAAKLVETCICMDREVAENWQKRALAEGRPADEIYDGGGAPFYVLLARLYYGLGHRQEGLAMIKFAQYVDPGFIDVYRFCGIFQFNNKQYDDAAVAFHQVLCCDKHDRQSLPTLSQAYDLIRPDYHGHPIQFDATGAWTLDRNDELVREHVARALRGIIRGYLAAGSKKDAHGRRDYAVKTMGLPANLFDPLFVEAQWRPPLPEPLFISGTYMPTTRPD